MAFGRSHAEGSHGVGGQNSGSKTIAKLRDTMQVDLRVSRVHKLLEHRCNNADAGVGRPMGMTFYGSRGTLYVDRQSLPADSGKRVWLQASEMKRVSDLTRCTGRNFLEC